MRSNGRAKVYVITKLFWGNEYEKKGDGKQGANKTHEHKIEQENRAVKFVFTRIVLMEPSTKWRQDQLSRLNRKMHRVIEYGVWFFRFGLRLVVGEHKPSGYRKTLRVNTSVVRAMISIVPSSSKSEVAILMPVFFVFSPAKKDDLSLPVLSNTRTSGAPPIPIPVTISSFLSPSTSPVAT